MLIINTGYLIKKIFKRALPINLIHQQHLFLIESLRLENQTQESLGLISMSRKEDMTFLQNKIQQNFIKIKNETKRKRAKRA